MHIVLLGTGTPMYDATREQSALVVHINGENLLFDAGRGVTAQMLKAGIAPHQVTRIFLTHHHYDHIAGLGEFLLSAWHNGHTAPFSIYGPPGTITIVASLLDPVFARDIAFATFMDEDKADIRALIHVTEVTAGWVYDSETGKVTAEAVDHGHGLGLSQETWPCFGYRIDSQGKSIAVSGDTVACPGLDRLARNADVLIQCCYRAEAELTTAEIKRQAQYVIASSGQVGKIAATNNVQKLVLTHIRPKSDALMQSMRDDVRRDYTGEIVVGEDLMIIPV